MRITPVTPLEDSGDKLNEYYQQDSVLPINNIMPVWRDFDKQFMQGNENDDEINYDLEIEQNQICNINIDNI